MIHPVKPWLVKNSSIIHSTPWIELKEDECEVDGRSLTYAYLKRVDQGPTIIPETNDGKLWLVKQYRHPIKKTIWQLPVEGRLVDESWTDAAQRGLAEELGLTAQKLLPLSWSHPDPGGIEQVTRYYLAQELQPLPLNQTISHHATNESSSEVEDLEVNAFSLAEIDALIESGEICDNWTLAGLYLYHRFLHPLRSSHSSSNGAAVKVDE